MSLFIYLYNIYVIIINLFKQKYLKYNNKIVQNLFIIYEHILFIYLLLTTIMFL